jgi:hypothetical protein
MRTDDRKASISVKKLWQTWLNGAKIQGLIAIAQKKTALL